MTEAAKSIIVDHITNGPFRQNCYVVSCDDGQALIVDPGGDVDRIRAVLDDKNLIPLAIINTHGHFDHIGAVDALAKDYDIPFYLHKGDKRLVKSANIYRLLFKTEDPIVIPDIDVEWEGVDQDMLIGPFKVDIIMTPGHTPGGVCFQIGEALFTGDTLMHSGVGTTKLPGGDAKALEVSIERLRGLTQSLTVYGGHGRPKTLGEIWSVVDADS